MECPSNAMSIALRENGTTEREWDGRECEVEILAPGDQVPATAARKTLDLAALDLAAMV